MSAIEQQESLVKESLFQFITKNVPFADLSGIDDIVLSYVISILEEASQDPCFDIEGFMEMMSAYVPEFANIDPGLVLSWFLELEAELSSRHPNDRGSNNDDSASSDKISLTLQTLNEMLPSVTKTSSRSTSESECSERSAVIDTVTNEWAYLVDELSEMFPDSCTMEIKHCLSIAEGDVAQAAATLLYRRERGQALSQASLHSHPRNQAIDDNELKNRIIQRYSYVDKNSATKEHKPLAPKIEPKKMVRYRDNKIVSLKGERYTEVSKTGCEDENLKKPKRQHCP